MSSEVASATNDGRKESIVVGYTTRAPGRSALEKAIAEAGVSAELGKVEKIDDIVSYGVALTPALVIDGEVKSTGKALRQKEIVALITAAADNS